MKATIKNLMLIIIQLLFLIKTIATFKIIGSNNNSEITLLLRGSGEQSVLYNGFYHLPDEVYINGTKSNFIGGRPKVKLNIITLKWNKEITSCEQMFMNRNNIIEIDLSKFNSSLVSSMNYMFLDCSSLKSINLTNFDTSQVTTSCSMFNGCTSLTSLDLSSFNTSKNRNMGHFFNKCSSLTFLNLSNFDISKVEHMDNMFKECISLISLDLSNFNFGSINNIGGMFSSCYKLEYVNLNNSQKFLQYAKDSNLFQESSENLVICIQSVDNTNINNEGSCRVIDCSDNWRKNQKKIKIFEFIFIHL